jgi:hypothetical protein
MTEPLEKDEVQLEKEVDALLNPRGVLYHYTNQQGLLGIISSGQIWASHIRYLNDTKEYFAGRSFIGRIASVMKELNYADEETAKTVDDTLKLIDTFDIYVTSFSKAEEGDSLNLWRAYAHSIPGFSIGFDAENLKTFLRPVKNDAQVGRPEIGGLFGVQYVPELGDDFRIKKEILWLAQLVRTIILALKKANFDPALMKGLSVTEVASEIRESMNEYAKSAIFLAMLLPLLKHDGFAGEQENRLVRIRAKDDGFEHCSDIGFHPGQSSNVPHLAVGLPPMELGIRRIVVGPCPDPDWAVHAVEMLLTKNRIKVRRNALAGGIEVVPSKIPYRNW